MFLGKYVFEVCFWKKVFLERGLFGEKSFWGGVLFLVRGYLRKTFEEVLF